MSINITIRGLDAALRELGDIGDRVDSSVGAALRAEAEIEMTEAKQRTPVLTGALRASGHVGEPQVSGRDVTVDLKFGGPSAPYAVYVHENLEAFHPVGEAKFLERTLAESSPHMAPRIAARIKAMAGV